MANILDLSNSGGQLTLIGGAFGLPTSDFPVTGTISLGAIRYNTGLVQLEVWTGSAWTSISGISSITLTGDVTGTGAGTINTTLADNGVLAGIYSKVTVDSTGRVTTGTTLGINDLDDVTISSPVNGEILQYNSGSSQWENIHAPYDIYGTYNSKPTVDQNLWRIVFSRNITFPQNLPNSVAVCQSSPTGNVSLPIYKNGVSVGSIDFATGQSVGTFTWSSNIIFVAGDIIEVDGPSSDDLTFSVPSWAFVTYR